MSDTTRSSEQAVTLTIDIGGTGTKMITVDHQGRPTSERLRELTPDPATPDALLALIGPMLEAQPAFDRVSVCFPGVVGRGVTPVLLGTGTEARALAEIAAACPEARDLCGQTGLEELATLARGAAFAVGNDTGPMHLIAAAGCPCLVLYSAESDPARTAPRGEKVEILRQASLADLELDRVLAALDGLAAG